MISLPFVTYLEQPINFELQIAVPTPPLRKNKPVGIVTSIRIQNPATVRVRQNKIHDEGVGR